MRKGIWTKVLAILLVAITCLSIVPLTAFAATTTPYYKTYGETYRTNSDEPTFAGPPEQYDIYMYGSSTSGTTRRKILFLLCRQSRKPKFSDVHHLGFDCSDWNSLWWNNRSI